MLDDDPNEEAQRQFRRQVDDDVANWVSQLDSDVGSGVPPPPQIKVTEVSSQPYEFDLLQPGSQNAGTAPGGGTTPAPATCPETCPGVTFSGVDFCCFSLPGFEDRSIKFDESEDPVNSTLFSPTSGPDAAPCCTCHYGVVGTVHFYSWPTSDCSGDFDNDSRGDVELFTARIAGVWHILLAGTDVFEVPIIFFYGTTTSLATPATNEITCGSSQTYDNPIIQCIHGSSWDMVPAGFNGTASLS